MLKKLFWSAVLINLVPAVWYLADSPDTRELRLANPKSSAIRTYREAQLRKKGGVPHSLMEWRRLDQISPHLRHAVVLAEDDTFFQHHGFDFGQVKRAALMNLKRRRFAYGASTLSQQLARTLYLSPRKNLLRKFKEALITRRLEKSLSKNRILELYLNVVEWGPQVYGAEAASQHFFRKSALELTPDEAISLAAILPSPRRWKPVNPTEFIARRKAVLYDRMVRAGHIPPPVPPESFEMPEMGETPGPVEPPPVDLAPLTSEEEETEPAPEELPDAGPSHGG